MSAGARRRALSQLNAYRQEAPGAQPEEEAEQYGDGATSPCSDHEQIQLVGALQRSWCERLCGVSVAAANSD